MRVHNAIVVFAGNGEVIDIQARFINKIMFGLLSAPTGIGGFTFDFPRNIGMKGGPEVTEDGFKFLG